MRFLSQCIGLPVRDPQRRADRHDRRPHRRHRRPLPAGHRPRRAHGPPPDLPALDSVESLDDAGARLSVRDHRHRPSSASATNEILLRADLLDKQIVDIEGRKVVRVNDLRPRRGRGPAAPRGRRRRRGRPAAPAGHRGPVPDGRAQPAAAASPSATSTGRTSTRSRASIASIRLRVPHARPGGAPPRRPRRRSSTSWRRATAPACSPSLDDEAAGRRHRGDGARHPGRGPRGPRARARGRHPRGDEPGRRGRPRGRPVRPAAATRSWPLMEHDEAERCATCSRYPEDSAGGIMTTEFVAVPATLTAAQTIDRLRELEPDAETIYYVYVVDDDGRLVGVLSLRDLIVARPETRDRRRDDRRARRGRRASSPPSRSPRRSPTTTCSPCRSSTTSGRLVGIVTVDDAIDTVAPQRLAAAPAARLRRADRGEAVPR